MHASEDADQLNGASDRLRRALDKVAAAEAALAQARRELRSVQRSEYGWTDGLAGRRLVADVLAGLEPLGWTFLDAVHWPGRPGVVIDHVGIGPGGVVVMFSRQWTGAVEVRGGVLRQNGIPRLRETAAISAAAGAVSALLDPGFRSSVSAFVCGVQHEVRPATVAPGVNVVGVRDVGAAVAALTPRLSPAQVAHVLERLQESLVGPDVPDQLTTRALTVYGDGPALPWPSTPDSGLFARPTAAPGPPAPSAPSAPSGPRAQSPGSPAPSSESSTASTAPVVPDRPVAPPAGPPAAPPGAGPPAGARPGADDRLEVVDAVDAVVRPGVRGRHRAPSRYSTRMSHRADRPRRPHALPPAVLLATFCGTLAVALVWLAVALV